MRLRAWTCTALCAATACSETNARPGATLPDAQVVRDAQAALDGASPLDAGGLADAGAAQDAGGACRPVVLPTDCTTSEGRVLPDELRCTGLYEDFAARTLGCGVQEYTPAYELWSDGAHKRRFVWLPPGSRVDVTDPDAFVYPVGTQFWKEFSVAVDGEMRRAETRLLRKTERGWLYTTYVWSRDQTRAEQVNEGIADWEGSGHLVPTRDQCQECHAGRPDVVLGWDFLLLGPGATGVTRETLTAMNLLQDASSDAGVSPHKLALTIPGDEVERRALGYLHVNCGVTCHNGTSLADARDTGLRLRLEADALGSVHETAAVTTGVNAAPGPQSSFEGLEVPDGGFWLVRPLDPLRSLLLARMQARGNKAQMPPLATHRVDPQGVAAVAAWIEHMSEARGYPAPAALP